MEARKRLKGASEMEVVVGVDGSDSGSRALDFASTFCQAQQAELTVLFSAPEEAPSESLRQFAESEHLPETAPDIFRAIGDCVLESAENRAREAGVGRVKRVLAFGDPAHELVDYAMQHNVGVIIVGSRSQSEWRRLLLGSVSLKVSNHAPCTCIIVR